MEKPESGGLGSVDGVGVLGVGDADVGRSELVSDPMRDAENEGV